jgi:hypothetical protein
MLASIYLLLLQGCAARSVCLKLVLEAVMVWRSADIETMIMILIILHSDDLVNLLIRGTFKDTAHPARTGEVCGRELNIKKRVFYLASGKRQAG